MVRAKFYVNSVSRSKMGWNGEIGTTITLSPVVDGSPENKEFYRYTPSGAIQLSTINEEAAKQFEIGKYYYVDFTPAPE